MVTDLWHRRSKKWLGENEITLMLIFYILLLNGEKVSLNL